MLRAIINYSRSCRCQHDFEFLAEIEVHSEFGKSWHLTYRCRKCGYVQRVKL